MMFTWYMEPQIPKQERESESSQNNQMEGLLSPVLVYLVLASILGTFITSFSLVLISLASEIYNQ